MVCSDERKSKFPFDIQHRSIITYQTESSRDFENLKNKIKERIKALLKKDAEIEKVKKISPIADTEGLSQHEIVALVTIMKNTFADEESVSTYSIKNDMNYAGFTDIAVSLALRSLSQKEYVKSCIDQDWHGNEFYAYKMEDAGIEWLMNNQEKLILRTDTENFASDDDITF